MRRVAYLATAAVLAAGVGSDVAGAATAPTFDQIAISGQTIIWSGNSLTQAAQYTVPFRSWTGTSTVSGDYTPLMYYANPQDNVNASAGSGTAGAYINHVVGAAHRGNAAGMALQLTVAATPAAAGGEFFALAPHTSINANLGGTNIAASGHAYGWNGGVSLGASATHLDIVSGYENGFNLLTGASVNNKFGGWTMLYSTDAVQGSNNDAAWVAFNQGAQSASYGWKNGIQFGAGTDTGRYFPISTTGTLLSAVQGASDGALTVGSLIDFSAIGTVTNYNIRMPNFVVTGAGAMTVAATTAYPGAVKTTPSTGGTVTFAAAQRLALIVPAGTLATLTVTLPACASANDGDERSVITSAVITALTVTASAGSVVSPPTATTAGGHYQFHCYGADTAWY